MEKATSYRALWKSLLVPLIIALLFGGYLSYVSTYYPSTAGAVNCGAQGKSYSISQNSSGPSTITAFQIPQPGNATFCVLYHVSPTGENGTQTLVPDFGPDGPPLMPNGFAACGSKISVTIYNNCKGLSVSITPSSVNYYANETFYAEITIDAIANSTAGTYMLILPGLCGLGLEIPFVLGSSIPSNIPSVISLCPSVRGHVFKATASIIAYQGAYALQN